eukprot:m51a1_g802 hypothetical protein (146) ;mRNA; f:658933-659701
MAEETSVLTDNGANLSFPLRFDVEDTGFAIPPHIDLPQGIREELETTVNQARDIYQSARVACLHYALIPSVFVCMCVCVGLGILIREKTRDRRVKHFLQRRNERLFHSAGFHLRLSIVVDRTQSDTDDDPVLPDLSVAEHIPQQP